jgi:uncharacterized protein involved in response to NO
MEPLLRIEEPPPGRARPLSWTAFMSLGFRPLYALGTAWAAASVLVWVFAPHWLQATLGGLAWHAHEMLWGFVATIAVGFLMTAGANWTGINPLRGSALAGVAALWVLARAGLLFGEGVAFAAAAAADVLFFVLPAAALGRAVWRARNHRNAGVPLLLLGLALADALFLVEVGRGEAGAALRWVGTGLLVMATIALLVARRVIPFFAMRAVPGLEIPMHLQSGQWQLGAAAVAVVASALGLPLPAAAGLAVAGAIALWQVLSWKPAAVRARPILWILYLGYAGLGAGLMAGAAHLGGPVQRAAVHVHLLAMVGFAVLIIGMVTRTALGHLGRALVLDRSMVSSYGLVIAAAAARLAALWPSPVAALLLQAAALLWAAGFGLYLWRFVPWLLRPRADEPSGRPVVSKRSGS